MESIFEKLGGTYKEREDGRFYPVLTFKEAPTYGKYGRMRLRYLQQHRPVIYNALVTDGTLTSHLNEVDLEAREMVDTIVERQKVPETLKWQDQMEWVRRMNMIKACAEETVAKQIIFI